MRTLALVCLLAFPPTVPGQPAKNSTPVSPEVHPDRTVTFRVRAPKATDVTLTADWQAGGAEKMTRDDAGVWSITVGPLEPGPAIYNFTIDGVAVPDPVNPRVKLRARTSASIVDVPGDGSELWNPGAVPHGRVELVYVPSKAARPGTMMTVGATTSATGGTLKRRLANTARSPIANVARYAAGAGIIPKSIRTRRRPFATSATRPHPQPPTAPASCRRGASRAACPRPSSTSPRRR